MNKNSEEMRKFSELILSALLFSGLPAAAQQADSSSTGGSAAGSGRAVVPASAEIRIPVHERVEMLLHGSVPRNPRHDLRLMFGLAPMFDGWGVDDWDDQNMGNPAYDVLHSKYSNSFFGRHCLGALSASYAYRVGEKWEIGAALSYARYSDRLNPAPDGLRTWKLREYYLSVMPGVRYSWICHRRFRLYSAGEAGAQLAMRRGFFEDDYRTEVRATGQLTLAGITVGRNFFFCCEFGVGCRGILVVGMGWRFDAKNSKR